MAFKPLDDAPAGSVSFRPLDDTEATTPTAADYLKGAASGVGGLVSGIGYLAEAAGANQLGGSIRGIGDTTQRYWQDSMTPAGQRAAQSQVFDDDPGSALPKLGDRWGQALAMGAAQSAPSMVAAAIPGGLAAMGLRGAAGIAASRGIGGALAPLAAGTAAPIGGWATNLAGNLAARVPTALGFGAAEGAVAGASNAAQWKSDIEQKPLAELRKMPGFAALEAQIGEQAARQQIAEQGAADIMARTTLATGGIGALTGGGALGSAFQRVTTGAKGGILGAIGRDAAKEAGQELLQSGGERAIQNIATRDYLDPNQPVSQGVVADALSGGAIGGLMGGVTGGASHLAKGPLQKAVEASSATIPPDAGIAAGIPAGNAGNAGIPFSPQQQNAPAAPGLSPVPVPAAASSLPTNQAEPAGVTVSQQQQGLASSGNQTEVAKPAEQGQQAQPAAPADTAAEWDQFVRTEGADVGTRRLGLIGQQRKDAADFAELARAEAADLGPRRLGIAIAQRKAGIAQDAGIEAATGRVEAARQRQAQAARDEILDSLELTTTGNTVRRFGAALRAAGITDNRVSPAERERIARRVAARDTLIALEQPPQNELTLPERAKPRAAQPTMPRMDALRAKASQPGVRLVGDKLIDRHGRRLATLTPEEAKVLSRSGARQDAEWQKLVQDESRDAGIRRVGTAIEQQRAKRAASAEVAPQPAPAARKGIAAGLFQTPPQPTTGGGPLPQSATDMPVGKYGIAAAVAQPKAKAATPFVAPTLTTREQPKTTSVLPQQAADMPVGKYGAATRRAEKPADAQKQQKPFVAPRFTAKDQPTTTSVLSQQATEMPVGRFGVAAQRAAIAPTAVPAKQNTQFDAKEWDRKRAETIDASRKAGNTHLDKITPSVESMRGIEIYYAHDPKERGVIRTVDNRGNVYVQWLDEYSAKKNSASASEETNRSWLKSRGIRGGSATVFQTLLMPSDLKDYVVSKAEEGAPQPASDTIQAPNGQPFKSQLAARRAASQQGVKDTHDVVPASEVSAGATGFVLRKKKAKDKTAPKNEYEAAIAIQDGNATRELTGFMKAERDAQIKAAKTAAWRGQFAGNMAETIASGDISRSDYEKLGDLVDRGKLTAERAVEMIDSASKEGVLDAKVAAYMVKRIGTPNVSADISPDISPDTAASQQPKAPVVPASDAPPVEPTESDRRLAETRQRVSEFWLKTARPALDEYFAAFGAMGSDRLERNMVKPEGLSATDWLLRIMDQRSTWDRGRRTGKTGIQMLSQKDFWPGPEGQRLRKAMLAAIRALRVHGYVSDWIKSAEIGSGDVFAEGPDFAKANTQQPSAAQVQPDIGPDIAAPQTGDKARGSAKIGVAEKPKDRSKGAKIYADYDSLLAAIAKLGGMNTGELTRNGFDLEDITKKAAGRVSKKTGGISPGIRRPLSFGFGLPLHRKVGGLSFDGVLEALKQYGYFSDESSVNDVIDAVRGELRGDKHYTAGAVERTAEIDADWRNAELEAEQDRIDAEIRREEDAERAIYDDVGLDAEAEAAQDAVLFIGDEFDIDAPLANSDERAFLISTGLTEEEADAEINESRSKKHDRVGDGEAKTDATSTEGPGQGGGKRVQGGKDEGSGAGEIRPDIVLRGQTPEEVAAAEAEERARAEAEREAVAAEEAAKKAAEKQSLDDAIKKRAENPDNFQFGEDGKAAAKPMGGLFEQPSAEPSAQPTSRATSGSQPEAVPPAVLSRIRIALNRLREVERELAGVERARGRGHILALELRDKQAVIDAARAKIADFRVIASGRGIDADAVIDELGGEPDFGRFGEPAAAVEPTSNAGELPAIKADGVTRAVAGGQMGVNGEWYEGGKFLPSSKDTVKGEYAESAPGRASASPVSVSDNSVPVTPEAVIGGAGLVIEEKTSQRGKTYWSVTGDTKTHSALLDSLGFARPFKMGGKWYRSVFDADPTDRLYAALQGDPDATVAPKEELPKLGAQESADVLRKHRLEVVQPRGDAEVTDGVWTISGKGSFDAKDTIKQVGGKWNATTRSWGFSSDPTGALAYALKERGSRGNTADDSEPSESDAEIARRRERRQREDARDDERANAGNVAQYVSDETKALIFRGEKFGIPAAVLNEQVEDAGLIVNAHKNGKPVFLLANEAGTGKTMVLGAAIKELRAKGETKFVYVTMNTDLIAQIRKDLKDYGVDDVEFHTYSELSGGGFDTDGAILIFDEAHNIKNVGAETARANKAQDLMARAKMSVMASATLFENPVEARYLAATGIFDIVGGFAEWAKMYGASVKVRKFYNPNAGREQTEEIIYWAGRGKKEDGAAARAWLFKQAIMTQRAMKVDPGMVDVQFRRNPVAARWVDLYTRVQEAYDAVIEAWTDDSGAPRDYKITSEIARHRENTVKRILEASKIPFAISNTKDLLAAGRNVVIFVETKADRTLGKWRRSENFKDDTLYTFDQMVEMMSEWKMLADMARAAHERPPQRPFAPFILEIARYFDAAGILEDLPSTADQIVDAIGSSNVAVYTGAVSNSVASKNKADFLSGRKRVLVATMAKGGTGLSLHDTVGNRPTTQLNINLPWKATGVDQVAARVARYGLRSDAEVRWLFAANIPWESKKLAPRVGARMRDMGAIIKGIEVNAAEVLDGNFDFEGDIDVKGGVAIGSDQDSEDMYAKAIRMDRLRRKADDTSRGFFETPLPLAVLMSRIAGVRSGQSILEPSAGRGNLLRLLPGGVNVTAVEVREDNYTILKQKHPEANVIQGDFLQTDFGPGRSASLADSGRQFDAVLMNPPFERVSGVGAQDIAHVQRAYGLLKNDGRLVAIMGEGAFFRDAKQDQEFRDWLDDVGATVVQLPEGSFKQSGTGVRTRMIVVDRRGAPGRTDLNLSDLGDASLREIESLVPSRSSVEYSANAEDAKTVFSARTVANVSPSDRAIYEMANEGKSTDEILSFLSKASRRPFNRLLATALQKAGLQTTVTTDSQGGWQVGNRSYAQKYAAAYSPKADKVALFTPRDAERHVLHELVHAATLRAIESGGVSAMRMRALFKHVQQSGKLNGQYGMSSLDEFVAEVFSNPKFRDALQGVPAPASSALKSVWQWFVRIVARIVGIKTQAAETALDRALRDGLALMEENAAIRAQGGGADRYATAWHGTPHVWAPEPGFPHGRPRLDKIGTGEGAQAYGWGWYSAESQGVANSYKRLDDFLHVSTQGAESFVIRSVSGEKLAGPFGSAKEAVDRQKEMERGQIYHLDIPDDVLPRLLDWYKPLSGQSSKVKKALQESGVTKRYQANLSNFAAPQGTRGREKRGHNIYALLTNEAIAKAHTGEGGKYVPLPPEFNEFKAASEYLASIGIPGLRYLDQGSRADGTGTYNYVIWDQKVLDRIALLERNGEKLDAIRAADEAVRFNLDTEDQFAATERKVGGRAAYDKAKAAGQTKLNYRQWVQVRTPAFKAWFGDWEGDQANASQVVDPATGEPLVVYHGTNNDFSAFHSADDAYYFAAAPDGQAAAYSARTGGNIMPVFLRVNNPASVDAFLDAGAARQERGAVSRLRAEGYDGVLYPKPHTDDDAVWITFRPEQIKSAIGNAGTFDGTDPDIRYNIAADWQTAPTRAATTIRQYVADSMRSDSNTSWLTPFNTQYHKAEKWAAEGKVRFKEVFNIVQQFIADTSRFAVMSQDAAPALLHEIKSLRDVKSLLTSKDVLGKQHRADIEAIASPLYDGTLYGGGNPLAGLKWSDSLLRTKYNLTDRQIKLYHEALAAVKVSMDEMAKSLVARHAKRVGVDFDNGMALDDMVADVAEKMKELQDDVHFEFLSDEAKEAHEADILNLMDMDKTDEARKAKSEFVRKQKDAKEKIAEIEKTIADIKAIEGKAVALQEHGYFPLMRFGRHTVTAKDAEGKTLFFGMYDGIPLVPRSGQAEANRVKREVQAMFPDATVETGIINDEKYKLYQGLNLDAMQIFAEHMDKDDLAPVQEFIRLATNSRSAMKRLMHREGTPGFDRDVRRTLAQFIVSNARSAASNYHNADMLRAAEEANKDGGDIGREAVRLVKYIQNPEEEAQVLRGFLFFQFLGGSIASAVVNLTQTPAMTLPFLSKFEPAGRLSRRLLSAAKMAVGDPKDIADVALRDALVTAEMDGVTAPQEIHQLVATAANNLFAGSRTATVFLRGWGAPFAMAESVNRRIAFISAFKIAQGMGKDLKAKTGFATPFEFAEDAVNQTQGLYNKGNRMNVGRGAPGAIVMTFKQFSIMYLELLKRLPPKQRAIMLGVLLISAGGGGLPGVEDAEDIWDTIGQWLGFASNSKRTIRNTLTDLTNPEIADLAINGLLSKMGIDLHSRLGMQNLLPGTAMLKQSSTDKGREITEVFGPAASVIKSVGDALEKLATGQPAGAAKALVPGAIRNAWQGVEMAATGRAEDARGRATVPVNEAESIAKVIGFNPKSVAQRGEVNRGLWQDQRLIEVKREGFTADIVSAILAGDDEAKTEAYDAMRAWNEDNPQHRVTINPATIGKRVREARSEGTARMVRALPKAMRQQAAEEFAR